MRGVAAILAAALAALPVAAIAGADETPDARKDWLLGDWGGVRTRLRKQGVDFQFGYVSEIATNASGGIGNVVDYTGQVTVGATLDLEKLVGVRDAIFQITYTERAGRSLDSDAALGTLQATQEVYGRGQTVRLTEMWFEQKYFDRALSWKTGRMPFGAEFATFPCDFQNNTFCGAAPGNTLGNYLYNWPISQWATRLQASLGDFGYLKIAAYDQNPQYLGYADKLLPVFYPASTGVLVPVEIAWQPKFGGGALPGIYKLGGWYASSTAQSVAVDGLGAPTALANLPVLATRQGLYGGYLSAQQQVTRRLNLFLNGVIADSATSVQDRQVTAGATWTGPLAARPDDSIAFAAGMTRVSNGFVNIAPLLNAQGYGPVTTKAAEYVFELDYTVAIRPGFLVRPNLQYVVSEGGNPSNASIWVLGLKTSVTF